MSTQKGLYFVPLNVGLTSVEMVDMSQYVRAQVGPYQMLRTRPASVRSASPFWNEDLMFVAAEPFDDWLNLVVEDTMGPRVITYILYRCLLCGSLLHVNSVELILYDLCRVRFWVLQEYRSAQLSVGLMAVQCPQGGTSWKEKVGKEDHFLDGFT